MLVTPAPIVAYIVFFTYLDSSTIKSISPELVHSSTIPFYVLLVAVSCRCVSEVCYRDGLLLKTSMCINHFYLLGKEAVLYSVK